MKTKNLWKKAKRFGYRNKLTMVTLNHVCRKPTIRYNVKYDGFIIIYVLWLIITIGKPFVPVIKWIDKLWKNSVFYAIYMYRKIGYKLVDNELTYISICTDPMNGCPGDFAEDGNRKARSLEMSRIQYESTMRKYKLTRLIRKIDERLAEYYDTEYERSIATLPWMNTEYSDYEETNEYEKYEILNGYFSEN